LPEASRPAIPLDRREDREDFGPNLRAFTSLHQFDLVREFRNLAIGKEKSSVHWKMDPLAASADACGEHGRRPVGTKKFASSGSRTPFGETNFVFAQRFAVGFEVSCCVGP